MKQCEVCGNKYDNPLEIRVEGVSHWFDCFECATHRLAPECTQCGVKILGHGVQAEGQYFCGAHCARSRGYKEIVDHTERPVAH